MTLQDFFNLLGENPTYVLLYFLGLPLIAWLTGEVCGEEGESSPWRYWYSSIIFGAAIPGVFAAVLNIYFFLFEKRPILESNVYTQILPIFSMVSTFLIVKRSVSLEAIPGFGKISGLVMMLTAVIALMWFVDRTNIVVFIRMNIWQVLAIFAILIFVIRLGWYRFISPN